MKVRQIEGYLGLGMAARWMKKGKGMMKKKGNVERPSVRGFGAT